LSSGNVADSGFYQLVARLEGECEVTVGRLGTFLFPAGYYVYTGSARKGLESRIARHLRKAKPMRWHIDYLLRHAAAIEVRRYSSDRSECSLSQSVGRLRGSAVVARGFGSSDCECVTHLFYFRRNPVRELTKSVR